MTISTHCLPGGSLGTAEISVPNISAANVRTYLPTGNRRGVLVFMHGLSVAPVGVPYDDIVDVVPFGYPRTFIDACTSDGWIVIAPNYPEDLQPGYPAQAIYNDVAVDTGTRHVTTVLHWWDHIVEYIHRTYGANYPIVDTGISWGGWHAIQIAKNRPSDIVAYMAILPLTILSKLSNVWSAPVDFTGLTTTGADATAHYLDAVGKPGYCCYHTDDSVVGNYPTQNNVDSANLCSNAVGAGQDLTVRSATGGHFFLSADATDAVAWVQSNSANRLRALCPRTLT